MVHSFSSNSVISIVLSQINVNKSIIFKTKSKPYFCQTFERGNNNDIVFKLTGFFWPINMQVAKN